MADNTNELERLKELQETVGAEYDALSEDYWRTRKLIVILRAIGWVALIVAVIMGITYIFVSNTVLMTVGIVCEICWVGLTMIVDNLELSTLRQWRLAMIKFVGWNLTADD